MLVNSYPYRSTAMPLRIVAHDDSLTVFEANCYDNEWSGSGLINWGGEDLTMSFTIIDDVCSLYVTEEAYEGSDPLRTYIYTEDSLSELNEQEVYSILAATS